MTGAPITLAVLGLIGGCIVLETCAHICFKTSSNRAHATTGGSLARQPVLWCGISLAAIEIVCWIAVLQWAPLTIAFPIMTLTYVGIPLAGMFVLGERMAPRQLAGAALVATGVLCVALSGA